MSEDLNKIVRNLAYTLVENSRDLKIVCGEEDESESLALWAEEFLKLGPVRLGRDFNAYAAIHGEDYEQTALLVLFNEVVLPLYEAEQYPAFSAGVTYLKQYSRCFGDHEAIFIATLDAYKID